MDKVGGSRLLQMQARFQQKQLQEREHKIASLYEAQQARALERVRHSPSNGVYTPPSQLAAPPAQLAAPPAQLAAPPAQLAAPPAQLAAPPVTHQPGKVRQMFEERRTKAGIDKSYPLQPIQNTERTQQRKAIPNGYNKVTIPNGYNKVSTTNGHNKVSTTDGYNKVSTTNGYNKVTTTKAVDKKLSKTTISHTSINSNTIKKHSVTKIAKVDNIVNGTRDVNHNHQTDVNTVEVIPQSNGDISNHYKESKPTVDEPDNAENNYLIENETFPEALAPTPTPRSAESVEKTQQKKTAPPRQSKSPLKVKPQQPTASTPRRDVVERKTVNSRPATGMQRASNPTVNSRSSRVVQRASNPTASRRSGTVTQRASNPSGTNIVPKRSSATDGEGCAVCGRRFAPDRLAKHQEICKKTNTKRRKPYDVLKHRLAGTEAEPFINKLRKSTAAPSTTKAPPQNSNWRRKHEEFIQAIRAAKKVQAHLSAGGKLSDLPPPPPSENPDYVQCPHCSRRFNQGAAERHIPKCANFQFNKTKKPSPKRR